MEFIEFIGLLGFMGFIGFIGFFEFMGFVEFIGLTAKATAKKQQLQTAKTTVYRINCNGENGVHGVNCENNNCKLQKTTAAASSHFNLQQPSVPVLRAVFSIDLLIPIAEVFESIFHVVRFQVSC